MTDAQELLVVLIAESDAIFLPPRKAQWATHFPSHAWQLRQSYHTQGLRWRSGAAGAAARQDALRLLDDIAGQGLVTVRREKQSRFPSVMVTDEAERQVRRLLRHPTLAGSVAMMERVAGLQARLGRKVISEFLLADDPATAEDLAVVETMALPAIRRGWMDAWSDINGHARYWITEAGRAVLATWADPPDAWSYDREDPESRQVYRSSLHDALAYLGAEPGPELREIGPVPLIAGTP